MATTKPAVKNKLFKNTKREKSTTTKGHYVTNSVLLPAVIEAKELNVVTDKLIRMIQMIAERYSRKSNFIGYSFREDMVSAAVMNLCNNALKFKPEVSKNPFSFYTTAIHNSFLQYMADEKKHRNLRDALLIDAGSNPSFNFMQGEKDEDHFEIKESDEVYVQDRNLDSVIDAPPVPNAMVDGVPVVIPPKEAKIRYVSRAPGAVTRYGPEDIIVDPITGVITIKPVEIAPTVEVKKTRKTAAIKEKIPTVKKSITKKTTVKETAPKAVKKTTTAKKIVKEVTKTVAKKPVTKLTPLKPAAKKITAKTAAKKPVEKKTTKKQNKQVK